MGATIGAALGIADTVTPHYVTEFLQARAPPLIPYLANPEHMTGCYRPAVFLGVLGLLPGFVGGIAAVLAQEDRVRQSSPEDATPSSGCRERR